MGCHVVDRNGEQIGFVDPKTSPKSLEKAAPDTALLVVQLDRKAPAPPFEPDMLYEAACERDFRRDIDMEDLRSELDKYFKSTSRHRISLNRIASYLVIRKRKCPVYPDPRKLAIFSLSNIVLEGSDEIRVKTMARDEIPGWTDSIFKVNTTAYVGQVRPWITHVFERVGLGSPRYYVSTVRFNFACGTEIVRVRMEIADRPDPFDNIQLAPTFKRPKYIYSSDRGIVWAVTNVPRKHLS